MLCARRSASSPILREPTRRSLPCCVRWATTKGQQQKRAQERRSGSRKRDCRRQHSRQARGGDCSTQAMWMAPSFSSAPRSTPARTTRRHIFSWQLRSREKEKKKNRRKNSARRRNSIRNFPHRLRKKLLLAIMAQGHDVGLDRNTARDFHSQHDFEGLQFSVRLPTETG